MMQKLLSLGFAFALSAASMFAADRQYLLGADGKPLQTIVHPELLRKAYEAYHTAPHERAALTETEELEDLLRKIKSSKCTAQDLTTAIEQTKKLRDEKKLSPDDYRKALKTILHTEIRENLATSEECARLLAEYFNPESQFRRNLTDEEKASFVSALGGR